MVAERVRRSEACFHEDCSSRRFYIDDDGFTYCDQGHQQSDRGTVVTNDTGELVITGRKQRRVESDGESIATSRSGFSQAQAYEHYLLCLQLVLRKQITWLISEKQFPAEFESIVKDLWALRIQNSKSGTNYGHSTDDEARSQLFSSQSEAETSTDAEAMQSSNSQSSRKRHGKTNDSLTVLDTISLIYIGMLLLHLPTTTADLHQWISDGKLLYYYSSKAAPVDLRRRLPGYFQRLLDPESVLEGEDLHAAIFSTISRFTRQYGMHVSSINHTVVLYRWIRTLALPIEIFPAVRTLARTLNIDFKHAVDARSSVAKMPEVRLMALMVVVTKLLFPIDDIQRASASLDDLSALTMDWTSWASPATSTSQKDHQLRYQDALKAVETDCVVMNDQQLDQYLDWYQDNIANDHISERGRAARDADFRRAMQDMFPVSKSSSKVPEMQDEEEVDMVADRLLQAQRRLTPRPTSGDEHSIGSFYRRYRKLEDLLAAPMAVRRLYELAAQQSAVGVGLMIRAVLSVELELEQQEIGRRDE